MKARHASVVPLVFVLLLFGFSTHLCAQDTRAANQTPSSDQASPDASKPASPAKPGDDVSHFEEMVVTATRLPTPTKELPVPVQVITRKEIEESRADDLSELLLEKMPEHFQKYSGALTSVSIRGFRSNTTGVDIKGHVLVLIDGHRAGTGNISALPLDNVERVEIVRGPGSVVYGAAAIGGVVNLITRKGGGRPSVEGGGEGGNWGYAKGRAALSGGFWEDKVGVSLTGRMITQGNYDRGNGREVGNSEYNDQAYSMSVRVDPSPNHNIFAVGNFFEAWDVGTPAADYSTPDLTSTKDMHRGYGSIAYEGMAPDWGVNWHLSYYHVVDRNKYNDPLASWGYTASTTETTTQGIRSQVTIPTFSFGRLLVGFDWDRIEIANFSEPSGYNWSPDSSYDNYAGFAEEKITWGRWTFLAGVRYDIFEEKILPTAGMDVDSRNERFQHASWRAGATYSFLDWLLGRAAVGTAFRAPTADELSGRYEHGTWTKVIGNPDLDPETGTTWEVGLEADYKNLNASLDFFYTDYTDKISSGFPTCVDGDCTWTTFRNVGGAVLSGIEGSAGYKIPFEVRGFDVRVRPYVSATYYTQRKLEDDDYVATLGSDVVPYVPLWDIVGGVEVNVNKRVTFTFSGFYTGDERQEDWNWLSPTYGQSVEKGGFVVYSTRLSVKPTKLFTVFMACENLTDKDYAFVDGYPMPGRTYRVGLDAKF